MGIGCKDPKRRVTRWLQGCGPGVVAGSMFVYRNMCLRVAEDKCSIHDPECTGAPDCNMCSKHWDCVTSVKGSCKPAFYRHVQQCMTTGFPDYMASMGGHGGARLLKWPQRMKVKLVQ